jgi:hypothetical protein
MKIEIRQLIAEHGQARVAEMEANGWTCRQLSDFGSVAEFTVMQSNSHSITQNSFSIRRVGGVFALELNDGTAEVQTTLASMQAAASRLWGEPVVLRTTGVAQ